MYIGTHRYSSRSYPSHSILPFHFVILIRSSFPSQSSACSQFSPDPICWISIITTDLYYIIVIFYILYYCYFFIIIIASNYIYFVVTVDCLFRYTAATIFFNLLLILDSCFDDRAKKSDPGVRRQSSASSAATTTHWSAARALCSGTEALETSPLNDTKNDTTRYREEKLAWLAWLYLTWDIQPRRK